MVIESLNHSNNSDLRIGVFICKCGGNISDKVDINRLINEIDANVIEVYTNLCSLNGRKIIRDNIISKHLDRVVIVAYSPISHEKTFQDYIKPLNPYLMDMVNLREQCSWVHSSKTKLTDKAVSLINASIEKVKQSHPVDPILCQTPDSVAVIGAGISGISAATSLARQGYEVYLIEDKPSIGGHMAGIGKVFSPVKIAEECGLCLLNPVIKSVVENDNVNILTNTHVKSINRRAGTFNIVLENNPRYVDNDKCISCGECAEVCPVQVPDEFNECLSLRKAIYKPYSQAYPDTYTIDMENCKKCGACVKKCKMDAIYLKGEVENLPITVGSVVIATGHELFDPNKRPEYSYSRNEDVITQSELGRIMGVNGPTRGKLLKPSNNDVPKRVVMIQCVGSRDDKPGAHKYCSKVCCMVALKNANIIKHKYPDTDIVICYTDIRTPGMYEKYYKHSQQSGIRLIRGRPGEVVKSGDNLIIRVEDTLQKKVKEVEADLVVLSTAIEPSQGTKDMAKLLNVGLTEDMFIKESHPKIKPVTTDVKGVYVCGTAQDPKDITESIMQANAAASKVSEIMHDGIEVEPFIAEIDNEACNLCGDCINMCKYKAMSIVDDELYIDPMCCSGCGKCLTVCKRKSIRVNGDVDEKIFATIYGMLKNKPSNEKCILVFLDNIGYTAADNIGVNRVEYPESIRIIKVHSVNRVMSKHIIYALKNGADGIFIGEYPGDLMYSEVERKMNTIQKDIIANNMNPERLQFARVYIPYFRGLADKFKDFDNKIRSLE